MAQSLSLGLVLAALPVAGHATLTVARHAVHVASDGGRRAALSDSLYTAEGVGLLHNASHAATFWQLFPHYVRQTSKGGCGPTTAAMALNTLASQVLDRNTSFWNKSSVLATPCAQQAWYGPHVTVREFGALERVQEVLACHGSSAQAFRGANSSAGEFRERLRVAFSAEPPKIVTVNYGRHAVGLNGCGHHSPVGAFDEATDQVLVLDVAKKDDDHPPRWYPLETLFDAMNVDDDEPTECLQWYSPRGYLVVGASQTFAGSLAGLQEMALLGLGGLPSSAGSCTEDARACLEPPAAGWRVVYFDSPHRGECLRLLLTVAKLPFEDVQISFPGGIQPYKSYVAGDRTPLSFDQVPLVQYGEEKFSIVQTAAAMQYVGMKTGLAPGSAEELSRAESACLGAEELRGFVFYGGDDSTRESLTPKYTKWMGHFERWLRVEREKAAAQAHGADNKEGHVFLAGNALSFADVHLFDVVTALERERHFTPDDRTAAYPLISALIDYIGALPSVVEYTLKRDG